MIDFSYLSAKRKIVNDKLNIELKINFLSMEQMLFVIKVFLLANCLKIFTRHKKFCKYREHHTQKMTKIPA